MRTLLGLCAVLLGLAGSCGATAVCSVPDTKKAYVTALSLNMAHSVGPCVAPDPSVLLALNLGKLKDPTAQKMLVKQLKEDAADKVSNNKPFSSGKVALYVLALRSSCADPTAIPISGGTINLVNTLEQKTQEELASCQNTHSPLTSWYQLSLDVLALCVMSRPAAVTAADALANGIGATAGGSADTAAMAVMALKCVSDMDNIPANTLGSVQGSLSALLSFLLNSQSNGKIGNNFSTGLGGQALIAAQGLYTASEWNCPQTLDTMLDLVKGGTFSLPIAAAQLLPFLWGESYVSVKGLQCPQDNAPMISVYYTVINDLIGESFKSSIEVQVKDKSTVLDVMAKAAELNPKEFSYTTETSSWGVFVTGINNLVGSTNDKTFWQFFNNNTPLEEGVAQYKPENGAHILAIYSKY